MKAKTLLALIQKLDPETDVLLNTGPEIVDFRLMTYPGTDALLIEEKSLTPEVE